MAINKTTRKRIHENCGGKIDFILLPAQVQTKVICRKCGETEMRDFLTETKQNEKTKA